MRRQAAYTLSAFGPNAEPAVPALIAALESDDAEVQQKAAYTLGAIGEKAKSAAPKVLDAIRQTSALDLRVKATNAIQRIDPTATDLAVTILIATLNDPDSGVRMSSAAALQTIGPKANAALPTLKELLNDPVADVRRMATEAVRSIQRE